MVDDGDDLVLVMDYLPGGNLAQRIDEHGPLPAAEVGHLADHLLDALAAAHRQGIVHRDIKPANVLFDADGRPAPRRLRRGRPPRRHARPHRHRDGRGHPGLHVARAGPGRGRHRGLRRVLPSAPRCLYAATGEGPFGTGDPRVLLLRAVGRAHRALAEDAARRTCAAGIDAMLDKDPAQRPVGRRGPRRAPTAPRPGRIARPGLRCRGRPAASRPSRAASCSPCWSWAARWPSPATATATAAASAAPPRPRRGAGDDHHRAVRAAPLPAVRRAARRPTPTAARCLEGFADYDGDPANGCEAEADDLADGSALDGSLTANLVPSDDVDGYLLEVGDGFQLTCDGKLPRHPHRARGREPAGDGARRRHRAGQRGQRRRRARPR